MLLFPSLFIMTLILMIYTFEDILSFICSSSLTHWGRNLDYCPSIIFFLTQSIKTVSKYLHQSYVCFTTVGRAFCKWQLYHTGRVCISKFLFLHTFLCVVSIFLYMCMCVHMCGCVWCLLASVRWWTCRDREEPQVLVSYSIDLRESLSLGPMLPTSV